MDLDLAGVLAWLAAKVSRGWGWTWHESEWTWNGWQHWSAGDGKSNNTKNIRIKGSSGFTVLILPHPGSA